MSVSVVLKGDVSVASPARVKKDDGIFGVSEARIDGLCSVYIEGSEFHSTEIIAWI